MAFSVNLKDRGPQVVKFVDLLDEGQYGAGEVEFRGRYETMDDLKSAIEEVLSVSPIEDPKNPPTNPLSFHRFDAKNKWGKRMPIHPLDPYPFKSRWMVHFLLCFHFRDDWCYVDIGIKWAPFFNPSGKLNPEYPLKGHAFGDTFSLSDLSLLRVSCGSVDDALELIKDLGLNNPIDQNLGSYDPSSGVVDDSQLEDIEDTILSITKNGTEYLLTDVDGETFLTEPAAG